MYYKIIEIGKNYLFCDLCGKCYIYKGSYEKHKLICEKKNDINFFIEENLIVKKGPTHCVEKYSDIDELDENDKVYDMNQREKFKNKLFKREDIVEIICPFYLFFMTIIIGFIKGIFCGF